MSKSRVHPRDILFQVVLQDFRHRQPPPRDFYIDKSGKGIREITETIPLITKLKWAKSAERAKKWASKFGSVISCRKVDSHLRRLDMISHLRLETKPIVVDIKAEEFTVGRGLEIEPEQELREIRVNGNGDLTEARDNGKINT